ncbi:low temperature requirement protein B [Virgibacillus phasianinus]|uniref:Low temperature requirement protein B n=1 Tax=Virgibacillus phasianinus TaxID=2017483 RepID=A0A220U117_9BACI|nr:polysaccharide biosynthesis protein [Virgibacillus phasianinus]ASK61705.1 low temperature requirement protein B [Virgibacillus phasianinus]
MGGNESNNLVKGALILSFAGLVSKILSAGYRVPLQNLTGDIGFYIYQQIYPFLGMALVLSLYGFPSAISKITNDLLSKGVKLSIKDFFIPLFSILLIINGLLFGFIYLNAAEIAGWMGNDHLTRALQSASFVFLLIPFTALFRGVFQGEYQMQPTALSQVGEQLVRVGIIITAALLISRQNIYTIGQAGAIAAISGAIVAAMILGFLFTKKRPWSMERYPIPWRYYWKGLLFFGIIAALNHMILLLIQLADAFTLVPSLLEYGLTQEAAMKAKGIFDRGQPLIQLGTVLGSSFALALIPNLSRDKLKEHPRETNHFVRVAMLFSFYLTVGAAIGLILIFPEANRLLFENQSGTGSLRILMLAIVFCSLSITAVSILQSLNRIKRTAFFIIFALVVKWLANQLFVPLWGITGSAAATVLSLAFLCYLVFRALQKELPDLRLFKKMKWKALGLAGSGMTVYVIIIDWLISPSVHAPRLVMLAYVLFVALSGAVCYLLLLLKFKAFTEKQLAMLPFASFLLKVQRGRNYRG